MVPRLEGPAEDALDNFQQLLAPLQGLVFNSVAVSEDRSLMIRFGETISEYSPAVLAQPAATLWVYCAWRFGSEKQLIAGRGDVRGWLLKAVYDLDKVPLTEVRILTPFMDALFGFADGINLRLFPWSSEDPHWRIRFRDGTRLQSGPGANWTHQLPDSANM